MKYLLKICTSGNHNSGDHTSGGPPVVCTKKLNIGPGLDDKIFLYLNLSLFSLKIECLCLLITAYILDTIQDFLIA